MAFDSLKPVFETQIAFINLLIKSNMKTNISNNEQLNEFSKLLLAKGFTIIAPEKPSSWFHFSKDNKIGYVQYERLGGANFSTVHKPCKECGTGYRLTDDYAELNVVNAESCLCVAPHWAKYSDVQAIKKYNDINDFVNHFLHKGARVINP